MKQTPFYHLYGDAKLTEFHQWVLPLRFRSQIKEHLDVRERAGLFDVSHMGELELSGPNLSKVINQLIPGDITTIQDHTILYSTLLNEQGGIIDDLLIYRYSSTRILLVVNAGNIEIDEAWIRDHIPPSITLKNLSTQYGQLALQGPKSPEILEQIIPGISDLRRYQFTTKQYQNSALLISRTGYTGEDGFELYLPKSCATELWNDLMRAGEPFQLAPAGLAARDTLRLEKGMLLHGQDITPKITPLEAGLSWSVAFYKPEFMGKEVLQRQKKEHIQRKVVSLILHDKGIPRTGCIVENQAGEQVGVITSGTMSPVLKQGIAMALIQRPFFKKDTKLIININGKGKRATVVKSPFV